MTIQTAAQPAVRAGDRDRDKTADQLGQASLKATWRCRSMTSA